MKDFITALGKRSSISCVTRERYGKVDLEFVIIEEAIDFAKHVNRIIAGDVLWPEFKANDTQAWCRHENLKSLVEIFTDYLYLDFPDIAMIAVESDESQHIEWRNRISWEFESGPKAADLFQRLLWILE